MKRIVSQYFPLTSEDAPDTDGLENQEVRGQIKVTGYPELFVG